MNQILPVSLPARADSRPADASLAATVRLVKYQVKILANITINSLDSGLPPSYDRTTRRDPPGTARRYYSQKTGGKDNDEHRTLGSVWRLSPDHGPAFRRGLFPTLAIPSY